MRHLRLGPVLALAFTALESVSARAQDTRAPGTVERAPSASEDESSPEEATPPRLVPPRLLRFENAEYPMAARAAKLEAVVELILTIDATGRVTSAQVAKAQGYGFDEAAQRAALHLEFEPARRDGVPLAARIRYAYEFRLPPPTLEVVMPPRVADGPPAGPVEPRPVQEPAPTSSAKSDGALPKESGVEVEVRGTSRASELRRSAEAVNVVELRRAKREGADLGQVLQRNQGIGLRRSGGLGSSTRFSLNGMTDDQVRFLMDGVPLELAGFGLGVALVPVNLIEHVEIYTGVVPIRFGTDALGGAVNLVSADVTAGAHAGLSYQTGSFGVYRGTGTLRHRFANSPLIVSASAFVDHANNDYPIQGELPDAVGRLHKVTVHRFHDRYRAWGANAELGVVELPWAERLLLRVHTTHSFKELQHNAVMTLPYGEVESREGVLGATLRYAQPLVSGLKLDGLLAYAKTTSYFTDKSERVYDWRGNVITENLPGELGPATETRFVTHRTLARLGLHWTLAREHQLRLVSTLNHASRTGRNALFQSAATNLDPARAQNSVLTVISGVEYELDALGERLENIAFVKDYVYEASGEGVDPRTEQVSIEDGFLQRDTSSHTLGAGNALRLRFFEGVSAKASYERATRLPEPDEVFGDGGLSLPNLELEPEVSHNFNLGLNVDNLAVGGHLLRATANGFVRASDQLIYELTVRTNFTKHFNVLSTRAQGVEGALGWTSPRGYVSLDANVTWAEVRNTSTGGVFADFEGDRIPNRPWLYANARARLSLPELTTGNDELSLAWYASYVREFLRGWESSGRSEYKIEIPSQLLHSLALTYVVRAALVVSATLEVDNLTDTPAYDFFGVQKPGRSFSFKGTLEY